MSEKGVIHFLPLLLVGLILSGLIYYTQFYHPSSPKPAIMVPTPIPTSIPTPTPTPSPIPTPVPTKIPVTPKPTAIPGSSAPVSGGGVTVLSIDLNSSKVVTDTGNDSDCSDNCTVMSLKDFVTRNNGFAGVNGTYFCPDTYPDCASKKNSFDFPVYNTRLSKWINGGNLGWNSRAAIYFDGGGGHYKQNASDVGGGVTAGVVNYPGLVDNGNVQIDDNQSGLSDKQKTKGTKIGIGLKDSRHVIVVMASNVNMQEFAKVFKDLGAVSALNLDTGGSTAIYSNGGYLAGPGRNIPNAIIFTH